MTYRSEKLRRAVAEQQRFEASYIVAPSGCWEWQKTRRGGYGRFWLDGGFVSAHRFSWELTHGEIEGGLQVNHKCHNRACVNPDHLYLGTQVQNMADMYAANRGRHAKGQEHPLSRATEEIVRAIRSSAETTAALAREYSLSESCVRFIRKGKTWTHVRSEA